MSYGYVLLREIRPGGKTRWGLRKEEFGMVLTARATHDGRELGADYAMSWTALDCGRVSLRHELMRIMRRAMHREVRRYEAQKNYFGEGVI